MLTKHTERSKNAEKIDSRKNFNFNPLKRAGSPVTQEMFELFRDNFLSKFNNSFFRENRFEYELFFYQKIFDSSYVLCRLLAVPKRSKNRVFRKMTFYTSKSTQDTAIHKNSNINRIWRTFCTYFWPLLLCAPLLKILFLVRRKFNSPLAHLFLPHSEFEKNCRTFIFKFFWDDSPKRFDRGRSFWYGTL